MALIEPIRTAAPGAVPLAAEPPLSPAAFGATGLAAGQDERLVAQVAYALAVEARQPTATPDVVEALRGQAAAALSDFAFRYLHNRADELRREGAAEAAARAARPPGFAAMVSANLLALAVAAAVAAWVATHPDHVARLLAAVGG